MAIRAITACTLSDPQGAGLEVDVAPAQSEYSGLSPIDGIANSILRPESSPLQSPTSDHVERIACGLRQKATLRRRHEDAEPVDSTILTFPRPLSETTSGSSLTEFYALDPIVGMITGGIQQRHPERRMAH